MSMVHVHARKIQQSGHHRGGVKEEGRRQLGRQGVCAGGEDEEVGCGVELGTQETKRGMFLVLCVCVILQVFLIFKKELHRLSLECAD